MQVPHLKSPRLLLRPYHPGDFDAFAVLNGDAEVRRYMGGPLTRADTARRFQTFFMDGVFDGEAWAVALCDTGDYIGHCWLVVRAGGRDAELGFLIASRMWRQGYGTEVAVVVLDYAFASGRYQRVVATVDADHPASIRVLKRAGMRREGERRDEAGVYLVYSITPPIRRTETANAITQSTL